MRYLNQLEYPHIPYQTNIMHGGRPPEKQNVAGSGCGPCALCMAVDILTDKSLTIQACVRLSVESGANHEYGTDLDILGPIVAEQYGITYRGTNELDEMLTHLRAGGQAIARVKAGLFTNSSHYILLTAFDGADLCILDPSYRPDKFERPDRVGKVNTRNAPYLYCHKDVVHAETEPDKTKYHLLARTK